MTDLKLMETKAHTYEVTSHLVDKDISNTISIQTDRGFGTWLIRITENQGDDEPGCVALNAREAVEVAEFIMANVRKRW